MKLSRAVQEFVTEARMYLSPASVADYESDLSRVAALASPDSVLAFPPDLIRVYFADLPAQGRRSLLRRDLLPERSHVPGHAPHDRQGGKPLVTPMHTALNHADLGTTAIYTKVVDAQTGEAVFRLPLTWEKKAE